MATQMQLEVILIGKLIGENQSSLLEKIGKTEAGMEHKGVCTGGGEWIKSP